MMVVVFMAVPGLLDVHCELPPGGWCNKAASTAAGGVAGGRGGRQADVRARWLR
jgi:hypothetical protein